MRTPRISKVRRQMYRGARDLGDVQAVINGPTAVEKRIVRKALFRFSAKMIRGLIK